MVIHFVFQAIWWFRFQPWTHVDTSTPLASATVKMIDLKPRIWIIWPWQTCGRAITRRPIHGLEFTNVSFSIISTGSNAPVSGLGSSRKAPRDVWVEVWFFGTPTLPAICLLRRSMISWWCMTSTCWPQHPRKLSFNWVRTRHGRWLMDFLCKTLREDTLISIFGNFWCWSWSRLSLSRIWTNFPATDWTIAREFSSSAALNLSEPRMAAFWCHLAVSDSCHKEKPTPSGES